MSEIPEQLSYTAEHEWMAHGDVTTVGITAFAVEELGEIVFVELPAVGDTVTAGTPCGEIESTKAVSEIYAPMNGEILEVNDALESSPETLGEDPYGEGWLFKMKTDEGEYALLDAAGYQALIES
ncbi:MAG: glycine cleavage system protein GcvH [Acidimicrobiaceae bacterium]|jgi:glycine cleavage system H protein|nr:glycine cleavage system protein GcvH [Acidimicrobiaceae bacterium]MBT6443569.1 glycine cleavage system protein GcvH [Acidimicrobiaceae bacterium]MCO4833674.1 glycine cleavage system protein GcvH [Acidimicrobiaceae bacterium]HAY70010.1 glycine cleavage system protein GcvH [Acidimicrobiaceae bacterium]